MENNDIAAKPIRVGVISEIPTPYRIPFFQRLAQRPELDLTVYFCAEREPGRDWRVKLTGFHYEVLKGFSITLRRRGFFTYHINPSIFGKLRRRCFDVLVIGGYSKFLYYTRTQYTGDTFRLIPFPQAAHSAHTLPHRF